MTTSDNLLRLVRADLRNVEAYAGKTKSGIDDSELSMEDVRYKLLTLKAYVDHLYQGFEEYICYPHGLEEEEQK